jgi:hypothetical protein
LFFATTRAALCKRIFQRSFVIGSTCGLLLTAAIGTVMVNKVAANNQEHEVYALVMIDGVDYGRLGNYTDLKLPNPKKSESAIDLRLEHSFVAENSLFQWAKEYSRNPHTQPRDISILLCNKYGEEVDRYTLVQTKPSSWSIEAAESPSGGFRENVQVFAQNIIHGAL